MLRFRDGKNVSINLMHYLLLLLEQPGLIPSPGRHRLNHFTTGGEGDNLAGIATRSEPDDLHAATDADSTGPSRIESAIGTPADPERGLKS
jgi:hypothetical protein